MPKFVSAALAVACLLPAVTGSGMPASALTTAPDSIGRELNAVVPHTGPGEPVVLTTFTVIADMAAAIGGDRVVVRSLIKPGAEIHGYEPTPSDLVHAQDADLILDNGLGLEGWFDQFLRNVDAPHVTLTSGIEPVGITTGAYRGRPNPHAWMSPENGITYARNIERALSRLLPEHAREFKSRAIAHTAKLRRIQDRFSVAMKSSDATLVTCEGAFSYLARDAGMREASLWPVNSDAQGTPRQIRQVISVVRERGVPAVFCESTVNPAAQRQVSKETGAHLVTPLYVDSLSDAGGPVPTYLDLLAHNARMIEDALVP